MRLTEHFTLEEFITSPTANQLSIDNEPQDIEIIQSLTRLAIHVLEPLRNHLGKPVKVTSGYRCNDLNNALGSQPSSRHTLGQAADIVPGWELSHKDRHAELARWLGFILENIAFDGLVFEAPDGLLRWVHVSYCDKSSRHAIGLWSYGTYRTINKAYACRLASDLAAGQAVPTQNSP